MKKKIAHNVTQLADWRDRQPVEFSRLRQGDVIKVREPVKWLVDLD